MLVDKLHSSIVESCAKSTCMSPELDSKVTMWGSEHMLLLAGGGWNWQSCRSRLRYRRVHAKLVLKLILLGGLSSLLLLHLASSGPLIYSFCPSGSIPERQVAYIKKISRKKHKVGSQYHFTVE